HPRREGQRPRRRDRTRSPARLHRREADRDRTPRAAAAQGPLRGRHDVHRRGGGRPPAVPTRREGACGAPSGGVALGGGAAAGPAMEAAAVSAARGLGGAHRRELAILPALFGGFQSAMAALGWRAGSWAGPYIAAWDHWIAFGLLLLVGGKMVLEALRSRPD